MNAQQLIDALREMPPDAPVTLAYDGAARLNADYCHVGRGSGDVVIGDYDDALYYDEDRPIGAPSEADNPYWVPRPS